MRFLDGRHHPQEGNSMAREKVRVEDQEGEHYGALDLDHHDGEGEHYDDVRRWGGHGGERKREGDDTRG
jgi:hypothetical protein